MCLSNDTLISEFLTWYPTRGRARVGHLVKIHINSVRTQVIGMDEKRELGKSVL